MFDLTGHVALITGGNGGIGLGMAKGLASVGADIAIWGRNETKNAAAAEELRGLGVRVAAIRCDVGNEKEVVESFAATVRELGKVDSVFANAGIARFRPFVDQTVEDWRKVNRINLEGVAMTLREGARHMIARGEGGSLIGIASASAFDGAPHNQPYAASKGGVLALMRGLAVELARHQIRCNSLIPGWVATELNDPDKVNPKVIEATTKRTPLRRWGKPEEYGKVAVYLADPSYLWHTGDTLTVDGGYLSA